MKALFASLFFLISISGFSQVKPVVPVKDSVQNEKAFTLTMTERGWQELFAWISTSGTYVGSDIKKYTDWLSNKMILVEPVKITTAKDSTTKKP